jgi:hypothetical protein
VRAVTDLLEKHRDPLLAAALLAFALAELVLHERYQGRRRRLWWKPFC